MWRKQCLNSTGSPESYQSLQDAEVTDIAWECLRRNADYRREYEVMRAPEVLAAVVPVNVAMADDGSALSQPLLGLTAGQVRRAVDGWHAVLRIGSTDHRVWSKEPPVLGASYAADLLFDGDFDPPAYAARRLWRAMNGRAPSPSFHF
ncbi:DUF6499 domain-containing protein [Bradyrhizobium sp. Gha]|uniref:transcriptional regulator domain-containing protein n=1 Tax=Bradyrhizobium sp. Gha TaxID=1855318 RepID=UPI0008E81F67|nr:DUF6499 domain-containing protein [Bradyrhizobium sp. Gha]SFJ92729.1 hypothetical protein SAMN05216525_1439 [Bradyrhizobium sp. Gha]